jgi:hypothetical protein
MEVILSTAAPTKPQATTAGGYDVARPQGQCAICHQPIAPSTKFVAALSETPAGFQRIDSCLNCWPQQDRKDVVAFWQTLMPRPEQKKKVFVDDTVLCELFERLGTVTEPAKLSFRFVLGLILMRKRLVLYESTRIDHDREIWQVRMKGRDDTLDLLDPKLDQAQIHEVSQQLGEILHQEL